MNNIINEKKNDEERKNLKINHEENMLKRELESMRNILNIQKEKEEDNKKHELNILDIKNKTEEEEEKGLEYKIKFKEDLIQKEKEKNLLVIENEKKEMLSFLELENNKNEFLLYALRANLMMAQQMNQSN